MLVFSLALLLACPAAWSQSAQLFEEYGVGARDTAMGNAFTGVANDYTAAYYNPAGLAQIQQTQISLGYRFIQPQLYLSMPTDMGMDFTNYPSTRLLTLGVTSDLSFPRFLNPRITDRISFGLAIAVSNYLKSFTTYVNPTIPYFPRYNERPVALLSIYVSLSVKITDWLAFGIGMVPASDTDVDVVSITKTDLSEMRWTTTQGVVSRTITTVKPLVGVMFRPPVWWFREHLSIGAVWRDEVQANDGTGESRAYTHLVFPDGTEYKDLPYADNFVYGLTGFSPQQVVLGVGVYPFGGMTVAVDGIWKQWSAWRNFMGLHPRPRWNDTVQARIGVEHQWSFDYSWLYSLTARAGWYFEPTPVPDRQGDWNLLDNDQHVLSAGIGMEIGHIIGLFLAPVTVDLAYQHHLLTERRDPGAEGDSFPEMEYGGHLYGLSASCTFKF